MSHTRQSGFHRPGQSLCVLVCFVYLVFFQFCLAPGQERLTLGAGAAPKAASSPPAENTENPENQNEKDDEAPEDTLDSLGTWTAMVMSAESLVIALRAGFATLRRAEFAFQADQRANQKGGDGEQGEGDQGDGGVPK